MDILDVLLPIFGIILIGYLLKSIGVFKEKYVKIVNDYVYYIGITVVTYLSLHDVGFEILLDPRIYVLTLLPTMIIAAIAYYAAKTMRLDRAIIPVFIICAFFGNTGYVGFPLNLIVQGEESLPLTVLISTIYTIIVFTFGITILKRYAKDEYVKSSSLLKLPIVWAALLGILTFWLVLPGFIRLPLDIIADSTSPLALLATGAMIGGNGIFKNFKEIGVLSIIKLALMPLTVFVIAQIAGYNGMVYRTALLEAAVPVGVTNSILAAQFGLNKEFASNAIIISTVLFGVSLSVLLLFL